MIFGTLYVRDHAIHTHNDSHKLDMISTISARRPFLSSGILLAAALSGFAARFADLLTWPELIGFVAFGAALLIAGFCIGNLQLVSRDLRGSELGTAIWGTYGHLNRLRREIAAQLPTRMGDL